MHTLLLKYLRHLKTESWQQINVGDGITKSIGSGGSVCLLNDNALFNVID